MITLDSKGLGFKNEWKRVNEFISYIGHVKKSTQVINFEFEN